jgi:quercetin dioxygenase-like cupin family protein
MPETDHGKGAVSVLDLDAAAWTDRGRARLKELVAYGRRVRLVEFLPGFSDPNWCLKGHAVYVLSGVLESEYADGFSSRRAGEAYVVPAGTKHRSRNLSAEPVRLLILDEG